MLIPHGTLIAVADGAQLELFRNDGDDTRLKLHPLPMPDLAEHGKDSGARHHASSANPDHHLQEEDSFVASVVGWLNHQTINSELDHLVIIAAPRALGEMRKHYHVTLKERLIGELDKDLTGQPVTTIEEELKMTHAG